MSHGKIGDCHEDISKYMNEIRVVNKKKKDERWKENMVGVNNSMKQKKVIRKIINRFEKDWNKVK